MDWATLPNTFADVLRSLPAGVTASDRVLEPVLSFTRSGNRIIVQLAGRRFVRGKESLVAAPSPAHAWVLDGAVIRPLPVDVPEIVGRYLGDHDPEDIPYSLVVRLIRAAPEGVLLEVSPLIFESARVSADSHPDNLTVAGLSANLYPYQARGVAWMRHTVERTGGLILADEMGLGKTIQIIALMLLIPPSHLAPALILCPTSLVTNWSREISRFAPGLSVKVHLGGSRAGIYRQLQVAQIVITTYDTMVNDVELLSSFKWSWVICDEAQLVKNPHSNRRGAVATIPRLRTILVTGTPVENTLVDLWSLADISIPGMLGSQESFEVEFPDSVEAAQRLACLTDPVILKRSVRDVASDLPPRLDIDLPLNLDTGLAQLYENVRKQVLAEYTVAGALVATLQLQLVCAHPWLRLHSNIGDSENAVIEETLQTSLLTPKIERVAEILREAFLNGRKVLVFSLFNRVGELVIRAIRPCVDTWWGAINGSTAQDKRQAIVDEFSSQSGAACLILNPKAAGAGLNITAATVVVHFTPLWNPALEAQASARAYRRGQDLPVTIYRVFYRNTVEEIMIERCKWKSEIANESVPISARDAVDIRRALEISPTG